MIAERSAGKAKTKSLSFMIASSTDALGKAPPTRPSATPKTRPMPTATTPTRIDTRAPASNCEATSRPRLSVPNQCAAEGEAQLVRNVDRGGRIGRPDEGDGRRRRAATATSTAPEPKADVDRESRGLMRRGFLSRGSMAAQATSTTKFNPITIDRDQHHAVLDHQRVAIGDRLQDQSSESGQHEDVLHHDRAGDEIGELQAHDGEDRNKRVGQGVAPERRAPRHALGARGAHEILVQRLEQSRARDPGQDRRLHDAERDRRKHQRPQRAAAARPQPGKPPAGTSGA